MAINYTGREQEIGRAEEAILASIKRRPDGVVSAKEVIREAVGGGVKESTVRSTIWFLLDRDEIVLTDDRKLSVAKRP
jgi:hypothetical protein